MLNTDFCEYLECQISKAFVNLADRQFRNFWCDGILLPDFCSEKFVNDNRQVTMIAYAGFTGQDKYELTLNFGPAALSRYAKGLDISPCVPDTQNADWLEVYIESKKIIVQLL